MELKWHHFPTDRDKIKEGGRYLVKDKREDYNSSIYYCRILTPISAFLTKTKSMPVFAEFERNDFHFIEWEQLDKHLSK